MSLFLNNGDVILLDRTVNESLTIDNNLILSIGSKNYFNYTEIDCTGLKIFPGFIDSHVHGGYGVSLESNDIQMYNLFSKNVASEGVTKYILSSVTTEPEYLSKCLKTFASFYFNQDKNLSKCVGIHLEGPFISLEKKGAHKKELIIKPDIPLMKRWINDSCNTIKMVTYDIENDVNSEFLKFLNRNKILGCVGHCNSSADLFRKRAGDIGCYRVTHLFNAMSGLEHANPGIAAAALNDDRVVCEIICDGHHVKKDLVKIAFKCKTANGLTLITDGMSARGKVDGFYKLGELDVKKKDGKCVLKNTNTLAGSVAKFSDCVKNFHNWFNPTDQELAKISSYNSAKQLNISNVTGQIKQGHLADLVILNNKYEVILTISEGQITYINNLYRHILKIKE